MLKNKCNEREKVLLAKKLSPARSILSPRTPGVEKGVRIKLLETAEFNLECNAQPRLGI